MSASTGIIDTVAGNGWIGSSSDGGPATGTPLSSPVGVAVDYSGNLYIADWQDNAIRKVTASTGIISTVAGNWTKGYRGDGGPATPAEAAPLHASPEDIPLHVLYEDAGVD